MNLTFLTLGSLFGFGPGIASPVFRSADSADNLWVQTQNGLVHGMIDPSTPQVRQFLGIPFAQPPLNDLRFAPPLALTNSYPGGSLETTTLPPSCMQYLSSGASVYTRDVLEFNLQGLNRTGSISEDCLFLGVWTPTTATSSSKLPVLIFIYGGGMKTGGIDVPYQLPPQWVQRTQSHIVVTFNYRVNIFGFPNARGVSESSGGQNPGLLDQRLAVEWVRNNIAAFGGDSERMVLWGQSAGSVSVATYGYAYYEDPIVRGLVMDSGTELTMDMGTPAYTNFSFVAENVGCAGLSSEPENELECMRKVPADKIEDFLHAYGDAGTSPSVSFIATTDEVVVFGNYTTRVLEGKLAKIPAIIGTNAQDGVPFATYNPDGINTTVANEELLSVFFCPSFKEATNRISAGLSTYRYEYFGNWSNISPKGWMGAYHSAELPMLFGTHPLYRGNSTEREYLTSYAMQDAYLAFAADGEAGIESTGWPAYSSVEDGQVRIFGKDTEATGLGDTKTLEAQCGPYLTSY